jgi:hypothetical protein
VRIKFLEKQEIFLLPLFLPHFPLRILVFAIFSRPSHLPFSLFITSVPVVGIVLLSSQSLHIGFGNQDSHRHAQSFRNSRVIQIYLFSITPEMRFASVEQVSDLDSANSLNQRDASSHMHENFLSPNPRKFGCSTNSRFKLNFRVTLTSSQRATYKARES